MTNLQTIATKSEAETLREDIEVLKQDVAKFAHDAKSYASSEASDALDDLRARMKELKYRGKKSFRSMEEHVVAEPSKSVAIAFFAGLATSILLGGRR